MRSRGCVLVTALSLLVLAPVFGPYAAPFASAATAPGTAPGGDSVGVRLIDVPASAVDDPRARLYVVDHLAPGTVIRRRIEISNTSGSSTPVTLYPAAATISGGTFLGGPAHAANELSTWTSVAPGRATVPAGGDLTATVTIAVPRDAAAGERYGVVWVEARSAPTAGGVTEVNRVGVRLYVSVGPGGAPASDFTIESLTAERSTQGTPIVVAAVHNTGGRALDLSGSLDLSAGPAGLRAGPFPATLGVTLAIGATEPVMIPLSEQLPAGPWQARVTLRSGLLERTAHARITFPDRGTAPAVPTSSGRSPWLIWAVLGLVLLVVGGPLAARRRRWLQVSPSG